MGEFDGNLSRTTAQEIDVSIAGCPVGKNLLHKEGHSALVSSRPVDSTALGTAAEAGGVASHVVRHEGADRPALDPDEFHIAQGTTGCSGQIRGGDLQGGKKFPHLSGNPVGAQKQAGLAAKLGEQTPVPAHEESVLPVSKVLVRAFSDGYRVKPQDAQPAGQLAQGHVNQKLMTHHPLPPNPAGGIHYKL